MRRNLPIRLVATIAVALASWAVNGCGGGPGEPSFSPVYVDPANGMDAEGRGSEGAPYRTITYALGEVSLSQHTGILLKPGTYDVSSGEVFPIVVRIPILIQSTGPVQIRGSGVYESGTAASDQNVAIVFDSTDGGGLSGDERDFAVVDTARGTAIWLEQSSVRLEGLTIEMCGQGVVFAGGTDASLKRTAIINNSLAGVVVAHGATPAIRECDIRNNDVGIQIVLGGNPDLGTEVEDGLNAIRGNVTVDLCNQTENIINALGNEWDVDTFAFTIGNCSNGNNIGNTGAGTVRYQLIPGNALLFPGPSRIELQLPVSGAIIDDLTPGLAWRSNGEDLEFAAIFLKLPRQSGGKIKNKADVVWAWHSKLGPGGNGSAAFEDGVAVRDGELTDMVPQPLLPGRAYYWAVWAWDDNGIDITSSSRVGYFITSN